MIGTLLVFALGFMAAALSALLFTPFLWQKAQRLARRRFDAEIPASVREMRGEVDAVRAQAAFDLRREEMRASEAAGRAATERTEAGRIVLENGSLRTRQAELATEIAEGGRRFAALEEVLAQTRRELDDVLRDRQALREAFEKRGGELDALHARHASAQERATELQARLAHLERRLRGLERSAEADGTVSETEPAAAPATGDEGAPPTGDVAAVPPTQETPVSAAPLTGGDRLRAAIAAGVGARAPVDRSENADIRERISDLAARVIRRQIDAEGPGSPVAAILRRDGAASSPTGEPTLAERVLALDPEGDAAPSAEPVKGAAARKDGGGRSRRRSRR